MRYWKIAPGDHGFLWVEQRDHGCIAVGWNDLGDLSKYSGAEAIKKRFPKVKYKSTPRQLLKFYYEVKRGDKVLANSGKWIYGLGTVTPRSGYPGDYKFDENLYYKNSKPVRWESKFWAPLNVEELSLDEKIVKRLRLNRAILELAGKEWEKLRGL